MATFRFTSLAVSLIITAVANLAFIRNHLKENEILAQIIRITFLFIVILSGLIHYLVYKKIVRNNDMRRIWVPDPDAFPWPTFPSYLLLLIGIKQRYHIRVSHIVSLFLFVFVYLTNKHYFPLIVSFSILLCVLIYIGLRLCRNESLFI